MVFADYNLIKLNSTTHNSSGHPLHKIISLMKKKTRDTSVLASRGVVWTGCPRVISPPPPFAFLTSCNFSFVY